jgi:hypothetical protein
MAAAWRADRRMVIAENISLCSLEDRNREEFKKERGKRAE